MRKRELSLFLAVFVLLGYATGCKRKPAYSDIEANRTATTQNQNSDGQAAQAPAGGELATAPVPAPTAPTPPVPFKSPTFLDQAANGIKDLPNYPGSDRTGGRIGPIQEANVASFVLQSRDSMDKVRTFYEQVIKNQRWTIIDKTIDAELCEWRLSKGGDDSAKVQLNKDPKTGVITILLVRGEKMKEPAK